MCYPVCGMEHIKDPLQLIGKSSPCDRHHITINKRKEFCPSDTGLGNNPNPNGGGRGNSSLQALGQAETRYSDTDILKKKIFSISSTYSFII